MKKQLFAFLLLLLTVKLFAQRTEELFDASWKFATGDISEGESPSLNDAAWRNADLPHDWSIEDLPNQSDSVIGLFSRWYSGSGIYRHVCLISTTPVHVEQWGVFITTPTVTWNKAVVNLKTTTVNEPATSLMKLVTTIRDAKNRALYPFAVLSREA